MQHRGMAELAQPVHALLEVICRDAGQADLQYALQAGAIERCIQGARVEQLIQQDRVMRQLGRHPGAGRAQLHQLRQGHGVFHQQGQVGGAAGNGLQQVADPPQGLGGMVRSRRRAEQHGHEPVELLAAALPQEAGYRPLAETLQPGSQLFRIKIARAFQLGSDLLRLQPAGPHRLEVRRVLAALRRLLRLRRGEHLPEVFLHQAAMAGQGVGKCRPVRETHGIGKPRATGVVLRQLVYLLIRNRLQAVLDAPQEHIGLGELQRDMRRQVAEHGQRIEHPEDVAFLQQRLPPAAHQLEGLGDELDLADTARAKLDVVLHALALDLADDLLLEVAQRFEGAEIEVAPVDKRSQQLHQLAGGGHGAGHRPCLDHGVAFPLAPLQLVVVGHGIETGHQRPAVAVGPQPHVDPVDEAPVGNIIEGVYQLPAELQVKFLDADIRGWPAPLEVGVGEDEVDIGREVQLVRAQLAHAQHHQRGLRPPLAAAVLARRPAIQLFQRTGDTGIGQV